MHTIDVDSPIYVTDNPLLKRLVDDLNQMSWETKQLQRANTILVTWGITSGSAEVFARLRAIHDDAIAVVARLDALGVPDAERFLAFWPSPATTTTS